MPFGVPPEVHLGLLAPVQEGLEEFRDDVAFEDGAPAPMVVKLVCRADVEQVAQQARIQFKIQLLICPHRNAGRNLIGDSAKNDKLAAQESRPTQLVVLCNGSPRYRRESDHAPAKYAVGGGRSREDLIGAYIIALLVKRPRSEIR
jgi:hypothetical protein